MCNSSVCKCVSIVVSAVIGIGVAVLFAFGLIPFIAEAVIAVLALAGAILITEIVLVAISACSKDFSLTKCLCQIGTLLLSATIGAIIASIVAVAAGLSIALPITTAAIPAIILVFLIATFFVLTIISLICLVRCILNDVCCHKQ